MGAALSQVLVECAPGNVVVLTGTGLAGGASVALGNQLSVPDDGTAPTHAGIATIAATYGLTSVTFVVPDGVRSGTLTVTAGDASTATTQLRIVSQYLQAGRNVDGYQQASEYTGEGVDTSDLAPGELDQVLRDASAYADAFMGAGNEDMNGLRLLQSVEKHKFRPRKSGPPRFWVWRPRAFRSLAALTFLTSNQIRTKFDVSQSTASDIFVNEDLGYLEMLAYAFGNYVLLGAIETIGFSANVVEIAYTSGYRYVDYPAAVRKATKIIATELLTYRKIQAGGLGGFASVKHGYQQYDRRTEVFDMPEPAKTLLRPFITRRLA